ncbi:MAG: prepilin-type N-terminal cleavage/methylation domain-containing protein [Oligoflexia bacterium]|nr:prepilin-type N-terminal cleavage/methylation domain-containing protein [Oligoflexia bacterium]
MKNAGRIKKLVKRANQGFTLVELMVVVAIIGILAAVAIPNFIKYQAKSRTTEAKIALASIFTAEQSFSAENSTYTSCLAQAGYTPDGSNHYYALGFQQSVTANAVCGGSGTGTQCNTYSYNGNVGVPGATCRNLTTPFTAAGVAWTATTSDTAYAANLEQNKSTGVTVTDATLTASAINATTFTAEAAGNISNVVAADVWTINQQKALLNTASGI